MYFRKMLCLSFALVVLCAATIALADVPQLINYQGVLTAGGVPVTTLVSVDFNLWDDPSMGTSLWSETQNVTPDADGRFNVALGSDTPIPDSCFWGIDLYLGVKVAADPGDDPSAAHGRDGVRVQ